MSRQYMREYYSDDEIPKMVQKLNTCYDEAFQWESRRAHKEHKDLFGKEIHNKEHYFRLRMGGDYSNDLKLSYTSMERFLFALFAPYPHWENQADKIIGERLEKVRKIMDQIRR